jgi:hypothetical protein
MLMQTSLDLCWVWWEIGMNFVISRDSDEIMRFFGWLCHYDVLVHVSTTWIESISIMVVDEFSNQNETYVGVGLIASDVTHRIGVALT